MKYVKTEDGIIYVGDLVKDENGDYCNEKDCIELSGKYILKGEETIKTNNELNAQQPVCIGGRNYTEDEYEKEQEEIRKNVIEYFKKSEMSSLSMLADIQYLVLNEMDGLRNKWLWKLYFNKIREDLQSFHGTEQAKDEEEIDVTEGE